MKKPESTICFYCGRDLLRPQITKDHVVAVSKGGSNSRGNLVWACFVCNLIKGSLPYEVFVAWIDSLPEEVKNEIRTCEYGTLPLVGEEYRRVAAIAWGIKKRYPIYAITEPVPA